jgi:hypothetical protein
MSTYTVDWPHKVVWERLLQNHVQMVCWLLSSVCVRVLFVCSAFWLLVKGSTTTCKFKRQQPERDAHALCPVATFLLLMLHDPRVQGGDRSVCRLDFSALSQLCRCVSVLSLCINTREYMCIALDILLLRFICWGAHRLHSSRLASPHQQQHLS